MALKWEEWQASASSPDITSTTAAFDVGDIEHVWAMVSHATIREDRWTIVVKAQRTNAHASREIIGDKEMTATKAQEIAQEMVELLLSECQAAFTKALRAVQDHRRTA